MVISQLRVPASLFSGHFLGPGRPGRWGWASVHATLFGSAATPSSAATCAPRSRLWGPPSHVGGMAGGTEGASPRGVRFDAGGRQTWVWPWPADTGLSVHGNHHIWSSACLLRLRCAALTFQSLTESRPQVPLPWQPPETQGGPAKV